MDTSNTADPFKILGVTSDAGEEELRSRYLELVRQFPPDREPDKFREIRAAFDAVKDPLVIADRLLEPPGEEVLSWSAALEEQKRSPPALTPAFMLSLGNRTALSQAMPGTTP